MSENRTIDSIILEIFNLTNLLKNEIVVREEKINVLNKQVNDSNVIDAEIVNS